MQRNAFMAMLAVAMMGGASPSRRIGRSGLIRSAWNNPRRVEAAEAKRASRREKVLRAVAAGGYRSATWSPT